MEIKYKNCYKEYVLKVADSDSMAISSPSNVFDYLKEDFNPMQEELYLLVLNTANKIIEKYLLAKGSLGSVGVMPADIFRNIFLTNGVNFIIAHNHPSSNVIPSEEDIKFTLKLKKASDICGLNFLDHIIYTDTEYSSLKKQGVM
jgi:DNA repair protein RadC